MTNDVQNLCTENYKILLTKINRMIYEAHALKDNIIRTSISSQIDLQIQCNHNQNPQALFVEIDKLT